jgi:DNA-binding winged helix-turn-helix (wHTH) protein
MTILIATADRVLQTLLAEGLDSALGVKPLPVASVADAATLICGAGPDLRLCLMDRAMAEALDDEACPESARLLMPDPPFRLGTLLEHVRRRLAGARMPTVRLGPWIFSPDNSQMEHINDRRIIRLTEKEVDILLRLGERRGESVDRETLLREVWGYVQGLETHTVETHIYRLRQKIEDDPAKPKILLTDGEGYKLNS